jgi:SHOCT-like protein
MTDPLERVLNLVAEGRLTADEAAPILDALSARETAPRRADARSDDVDVLPASPASGSSPKFARIQVIEGGRRVVDLRIPTSLGKFALGRVPGLSGEQIGELQRAISSGITGPLLNVEDEDGDGVRIMLE